MKDVRTVGDICKAVIRVVNNVGCSTIVSNIITSTLIPGHAFANACVKVSSLCIGSALSDVTNVHTCKKIDEVIDAYENGTLTETILGLENNAQTTENESEEEES